MSQTTAASETSSPFANLLKKWRKVRKYSQLELSLEAGISQRHLSFLESGRSRPGKDTVILLTEALQMPLRDRNTMLKAAGFGSVYTERAMDDKSMGSVKQALEMTLQHHDPYPAIVVDRRWNLYMSNHAANKLMGIIGRPDPSLLDNGNVNIYRLTFSPKGIRPLVTNWPEVASQLLLRLQREVIEDAGNEFLANLFDEVQTMAGTKPLKADDIATTVAPVASFNMKAGDIELNMFSMISSFGTALDVTASELKVETFFPGDERTRQYFLEQSKN